MGNHTGTVAPTAETFATNEGVMYHLADNTCERVGPTISIAGSEVCSAILDMMLIESRQARGYYAERVFGYVTEPTPDAENDRVIMPMPTQ